MLTLSYFVNSGQGVQNRNPVCPLFVDSAHGRRSNDPVVVCDVERAVIVTRGRSLEAPLGELRKLNTHNPATAASNSAQEDIAMIVKETLNALDERKIPAEERGRKQREDILRALTESKGRVGGPNGAAARMGINRSTLLARIKKFGIDPRKYA